MEFQAPIGTNDVFGAQSLAFESVVSKFASLVERAGFTLVISPMFEDANLFSKGAGQSSDVVRKEMYEFEDRGGRRLALRPEGTASIVRAFIEHSPPTPFRAWYVTPAFRYEKPQAGRFRQHHQLGVEVLGSPSPLVDGEVIDLAQTFLLTLSIPDVTLYINSMGDENCRPNYRVQLSEYFNSKKHLLCDEHTQRFEENPLRVLDCKKIECVNVSDEAPFLIDFLCEPCAKHHREVLSLLELLQIKFEENPKLVRGFDYYTRTTFEFQAKSLKGSQNAVGGGGRYDSLVKNLGGKDTPGIGFGIGIERVLLAQKEFVEPLKWRPDVYVVDLTTRTLESEHSDQTGLPKESEDGDHSEKTLLSQPSISQMGLKVSKSLRQMGLKVLYTSEKASAKSQMRSANRSEAKYALIFGQRELDLGVFTLKDLQSGNEKELSLAELLDEIIGKK